MRLSSSFRYKTFFRRLAVATLAVHLGMIVANGAMAAPLKILALGDSLTAGYGLAEADGFCPQLEKALKAAGHDVQVIDGGVSGDTTADGLARLDWTLADNPDVVIVELGANDALRGLDPAQAKANLEAILTRLEKQGRVVLLAGMKAPRNLGPDYDQAFDAMYPELAARHRVALYPFFLEGVATDPALSQADGIHPNSAGVAVIVRRILPAVEKALAQVKSD
jgi:acyl-CoA thioesterase-1